MATLATDTRNAAVNAVTDLCDAGSIQFQTAAHNKVAEPTFGATAFNGASGGTATAKAIADDTNATSGTISHAHIYKTGGVTEVMQCTCSVTGGGGDFQVSSLVIGTGDTVSVVSMTITQPAS